MAVAKKKKPAAKKVTKKKPAAKKAKTKNKVDKNDHSPLHDAIVNDHEEIAKVLICAGAELNLADGNGRTPLIAVSERDQVEIVRKQLFL